MLVVLGLVQLTNRIDFTDDSRLWAARVSYGVAQLIVLIVCQLVLSRIQTANDRTPLRYSEPPPPFSSDPPKAVVTTVTEYDEENIRQVIKQTCISILVIALVHWKWGYVQPLVLQSVLPFRTLYANKALKIHLLGKKAEGDLQRPWKADTPFAGMFDSSGYAVDGNRTAPATSRNEERREKRRLEKEARKQQ